MKYSSFFSPISTRRVMWFCINITNRGWIQLCYKWSILTFFQNMLFKNLNFNVKAKIFVFYIQSETIIFHLWVLSGGMVYHFILLKPLNKMSQATCDLYSVRYEVFIRCKNQKSLRFFTFEIIHIFLKYLYISNWVI